MKHYVKNISLETKVKEGIFDITENIRNVIKESGYLEGQLIVQSMHSTAALFVNEPETRLHGDIMRYLSRYAPRQKGEYRHDDITERDCPENEPENGHAHLRAVMFLHHAVPLIVQEGELQLGRYQRVYFVELDGPCPRELKQKRTYKISFLGE